jgi:hypothetical protein
MSTIRLDEDSVETHEYVEGVKRVSSLQRAARSSISAKKRIVRADTVDEDEPPSLVELKSMSTLPSESSDDEESSSEPNEPKETIESYLSDLSDELELFDPSQIFVSVHRCYYWDPKDNIRKGRIYLTNSELLFKCAHMPFLRLRLSLKEITDVSKVKNYMHKYESVVLIETKGGKSHAFFKFKIPKNLVKNLILQLIEKHKRTLSLSSSDSGNGNNVAKKSEPNVFPKSDEPVDVGQSVAGERNAKVIFRRVSQPMKDKLSVMKPPRTSISESTKPSDSPSIYKRDSLEIRNEEKKLSGTPSNLADGKKISLNKIKKIKSFDEVTSSEFKFKANTDEINKYVGKYAKNGKKIVPLTKSKKEEIQPEVTIESPTSFFTKTDNCETTIENKNEVEAKEEPCEAKSETISFKSSLTVHQAFAVSKTIVISNEEYKKMESNNRFILIIMFLSLISFTFITINNVMKASQIELQILDLM